MKKKQKQKQEQNSKSKHAEFFEKVFSDRFNALDFIKGIFPQHILKHLNLRHLKRDTVSYVSEDLKRFFSDAVYTCPLKNANLRISILFEHKSSSTMRVHFQLLRYMLRIWDINIENKEPLSIVIPVVVYHGKRKWHNKPMTAYFGDIPGFLKCFIPDFDYLLADLSAYSDEEINSGLFNRAPLIIAASVMKHIFDEKQFETILKAIFSDKSPFLSKTAGLSFLKVLSLYIIDSTKIPTENYYSILGEVSQEARDIGMTTGELLRKEGVEKAKIETIERMLEKGYNWPEITDITDINKSDYGKFKKRKK